MLDHLRHNSALLCLLLRGVNCCPLASQVCIVLLGRCGALFVYHAAPHPATYLKRELLVKSLISLFSATSTITTAFQVQKAALVSRAQDKQALA